MSTTSIKTGRPCCQNIPIPYKVKFRINGIIRKTTFVYVENLMELI